MTENKLIDIRPLVGRTFVASSGNMGLISALGNHGVQVTWDWRPNDADDSEFQKWAGTQLGANPDKFNPTVFMAGNVRDKGRIERQRAAYERFLEEYKKPN